MRTQMEEMLRRKGELSNGMSLDLVRQYVDMTGRGEIWVNATGLPVRQQIHLGFPAQKGAEEWVEADVATNFSQWQTLPRAPLSSLWRDPAKINVQGLLTGMVASVGLTPEQVQEPALALTLFCLLAALGGLIIRYRRSRYFYAGWLWR